MDGVAKLVKLRHSVTILHVKMEVRAKVHVNINYLAAVGLVG
jgi:hypothetical protein